MNKKFRAVVREVGGKGNPSFQITIPKKFAQKHKLVVGQELTLQLISVEAGVTI